jgi:hypothetical protein
MTGPDLEAGWEVMLTMAREIGSDAALALTEIEIVGAPRVAADGWSEEAQVTFSVGATLGSRDGWVSPWKRAPNPWQTGFGSPPLWRTDETWRELLRKAWARERPFRGAVRLLVVYMSSESGVVGSWQIRFDPFDGTFHHPSKTYRLEDGALVGPA